ncbi:MAG: proprotein convertase P-domain-containing protein, partial [Marinicellaceae bacterium]
MQKRTLSKIAIALVSTIMSVNLANAETFTFAPTSIVPVSGDLPDNGCPGNGVTATFNVADTFVVRDVDLGVNILHTFRGDLDMTLLSPSNTSVTLATDIGGGNDNLNVLFNSDSNVAVQNVAHATAPDFVNNNQPEVANALDAFDGENSNGTWTFFVCDDEGADLGTLDAIELRLKAFEYEDETTTTLPDANCAATTDITFNVTDNFIVDDLNVGFMLTVTRKSDIELTLSSPLGTTATLFDGVAGFDDNFNVLLDSDAPSNQLAGNHAVPGAVNYELLTQPEVANALDIFDGESANGIWTLSMCDGVADRTSEYLRSLLQFEGTSDFALSVVKSNPTIITDVAPIGDVSAGDTIEYTIIATNIGTEDLENVIVSDSLLTPSSNTCSGTTAPNGTCSLTGTYSVTPTDELNGSISNTASGQSDELLTAVNSNTVVTPVIARNSSLSVVKSDPTIKTDSLPNGIINEDDVLEYVVEATNDGNVSLTNVIVSDPLLTPNSFTCPNLAVGATCTLEGIYSVSDTDRQLGSISNTAAVESDNVASIDSNTVVTPVDAQISVVKSNTGFLDRDFNGFISTGDRLNYTVTATNTGNAVNIEVEDALLTPSSNACLNVLTNDTCVLNGTYNVLAVDNLAGNILNTATASVNGGNTVESNTVKVVVGENAIADAESSFYMPLPEYDALTG